VQVLLTLCLYSQIVTGIIATAKVQRKPDCVLVCLCAAMPASTRLDFADSLARKAVGAHGWQRWPTLRE